MSPTAPFPSITVAICTYNRCESLSHTLQSLCQVRAPDGLCWDILIVDNNSSDATAQTVRQFEARLPLRYAFEPQQGLSHARNRAVQDCTADLLLFTDDDVFLEPEWLAAYAAAAARYPHGAYFGGGVVPHWVGGRPRWYREETLKALGGLIVSYTLGSDDRLYAEGDSPPIGASFGFRRKLLDRLGPFRVDLGTRGTQRGAGEDTEMLLRARQTGAIGVYVGSAVCRHCVETRRTTCWHAFEYGYYRGRDEVAMAAGVDMSGSISRAALYAFRGVYQALKLRGDRLRLCLRNAGLELGRRAALRQFQTAAPAKPWEATS